MWANIEFWNISWSINTTNDTWNLSIKYTIKWINDKEWIITVIWHKENWKWISDKMVLNIWEKEYDLYDKK